MKLSERIKPINSYKQMPDSLAMLKLLAQSQHSIEGGRYKPAKKAFTNLAAGIKALP
jgi:hypothetical protein